MTLAENANEQHGREQAWSLLCEWTQTENLRKHAQAVEICVTAYGEAEADRLGLTGGEREKFLSEEWPRIQETIRRLGLSADELLGGKKEGA